MTRHKKSAIACAFSVSITLFIFLGLATLHVDRVSLQLLHSHPTTYYKFIKAPPKVSPSKPQKIKQKKRTEPSQRPPQKKTIRLTPTAEPDDLIAETPTVLDLSEVDQEAVVIHRIIPKYPNFARKAGIEGNVLIEIVVDTSGNVVSAVVTYSSKKGFGFEENALKAVRKLRFEPFIKNGKPVQVNVVYPIDFVLVE